MWPASPLSFKAWIFEAPGDLQDCTSKLLCSEKLCAPCTATDGAFVYVVKERARKRTGEHPFEFWGQAADEEVDAGTRCESEIKKCHTTAATGVRSRAST